MMKAPIATQKAALVLVIQNYVLGLGFSTGTGFGVSGLGFGFEAESLEA